jgi:pyruvate/2-oxoglutarate dehydrogenase complex dihydrolipoamide dehydrogenase (E3) component
MPRGYDYNLIVIGGGSAGLVGAYMATTLKAKVALIEKGKMGGDCLHTGCVPSKALIKTAKVFSLRHRAAEFGIESIEMEMNFPLVMKRLRRIIERIASHDSVERYNALGVACYEGAASILSPREVVVSGKLLRTRSILLATGARPFVPEIEGLAAMNPLTSDTVWGLETLPRRLLVLGGGAIGCELAQAFQRLGSQVTLVERNERVLPREDKEVGELLRARFESEGMRLVLKASGQKFRLDEGEKVMECEGGVRVPFDEVIVALGRRPNTEGLGLEKVGVALRENGSIETNLSFRTTRRGIYACGDVTGPYQFTHFASLSGSTAAINALLWPIRRKADLSVFPWAVFSDPEVARVGLNETEARKAGLGYELTKIDFSRSDRALTEEESGGFAKVLTAKGSDRILGAVIVGLSAGELIQEIAFAMKHGIGMRGILDSIHAYPTLMEVNRLAAGTWMQNQASPAGLSLLKGFHRFWRKLP